MTKKINEASIKVDVNGLESGDFETLSRMLALAGQAEKSSNPGFSELPKMQPFDFDSAMGDEETQPIMNPDDAMSAEDELGDVGSELGGEDELGAAIDDLAGTVTDFGADEELPGEEDELSLDLDGEPALDSEPEDDFDMDRMSSLAGLGESVSLFDNDEEEISEALLPDLSLDEDANSLDDAHGPYRSEAGARDDAEAAVGGDFVIIPSHDGYYWKHQEADVSNAHGPYQSEVGAREDAEQATGNLDFHIYRRRDGYYWEPNTANQDVYENADDSKEHGPFRTEREAVHDGMRVTNGTEYEHFIVIPGQDGYYWKRNIQEELDNEPDPSTVDTDGIEHSRHEFKKQPGTALGDNPLRESEDGEFSPEGNPEMEKCNDEIFEDADADEDDEDDSVEDILESINKRYDNFMRGI